MRISSLNALPAGLEELGVLYASVDGVNERSYEECLEKLIEKAHGLGATALVALQLVQSQFQWNQRTSLLATAIRESTVQPAKV
jgi:uncharacterized protein YbjQ (UPF0145 family)